MRNGYGIRKSVSYGVASRYRSKDVKDSLTSLRSEDGDERVQRERDRRFDENRGGFVLRAKSDLTEEVAAGVQHVSSGAYMPNGGNNLGGNIMTNALKGRRVKIILIILFQDIFRNFIFQKKKKLFDSTKLERKLAK